MLAGRADLSIEGRRAPAGPGDVPADVEFQITATGSEPFQAMCCLPIGGQAVLADGNAFTPPWAQATQSRTVLQV